jgi:chromate transporter
VLLLVQFNKVLAVYQALPGPEATELCCYFGLLSRGRVGSVLAGLGFILPGFVLMLVLAIVYDQSGGLHNDYVQASFTAVQCATTAMIFRAIHRIAENALVQYGTGPQTGAASKEKDQFSEALLLLAGVGLLLTVMRVNMFVTLVLVGLLYVLVRGRNWWIMTALLVVCLIIYVLVAVLVGLPSSADAAATSGSGTDKNLGNILLYGFGAGLLTFGGAYTAIPFLQAAAVGGGWLTAQQFLDAIALAHVVPTPLIMFGCFVGYLSGGVAGALLMTFGVFFPAFSFTLIGHQYFERIVESPRAAAFLDGVTASVIGMVRRHSVRVGAVLTRGVCAAFVLQVMVTAFQLTRNLIVDSHRTVLFVLTLLSLYRFQHRFLAPMLIATAACVGQMLFIEGA